MSKTLMILPASDARGILLVRIPDDYESHEAFRHVADLEDNGFETVEFILGPALP
jgi:hypothetical protein